MTGIYERKDTSCPVGDHYSEKFANSAVSVSQAKSKTFAPVVRRVASEFVTRLMRMEELSFVSAATSGLLDGICQTLLSNVAHTTELRKN